METPNYTSVVPDELIAAIFFHLSPDELKTTRLVCLRFDQIVNFLLKTNEYAIILAQSLLGRVRRNAKDNEVLKEIHEVIDFVSGYFPLSYEKPKNNKEILSILRIAIERVSEALLSKPTIKQKKLSYWFKEENEFELSSIYAYCNDERSLTSKHAAFRFTLSKLKKMSRSIPQESYILPLAIQAGCNLETIQALVTHKAPINVELPAYLGGEVGIIEWCIKLGASQEIIKFLIKNGGSWGAYPKEFLADAEISEDVFNELKKIPFLRKLN
ncbi:F-box protein [Criblamydia sequanensis]|uniref:F-box domain-containing protein n=1 Tax=Candidatus Criblamydia sequanensis CRIB-18 TaxID=1437425 RepID=A0A090E2S3_9BACT|nr:F-box protein [Criblamydia sequanensis]CDR34939.1 F-box domain-containing protein [Criblamydia sequanensis CRIB-18]